MNDINALVAKATQQTVAIKTADGTVVGYVTCHPLASKAIRSANPDMEVVQLADVLPNFKQPSETDVMRAAIRKALGEINAFSFLEAKKTLEGISA